MFLYWVEHFCLKPPSATTQSWENTANQLKGETKKKENESKENRRAQEIETCMIEAMEMKKIKEYGQS